MQSELANRSYKPPPVRGFSTTLDETDRRGPHRRDRRGKGYFDWGGRSAEELFQNATASCWR